MRQLAWLHTTPKAPTSHAVSRGAPRTLSRIAKMKADGVMPRLPEVSCRYLLDIFLEMGPVQAGGMAAAILSQNEIAKWQENTGIRLQPWEARFMRRLSGVWIEQAREAEEPMCLEPYADITPEQIRARVDAKIDAIFG